MAISILLFITLLLGGLIWLASWAVWLYFWISQQRIRISLAERSLPLKQDLSKVLPLN